MKKLLLSLLLITGAFEANARMRMLCKDGQASVWRQVYHTWCDCTDWEFVDYAGGCGGGNWWIDLAFNKALNPDASSTEIGEAQYTAMNTLKDTTFTPDSTIIRFVNDTAANVPTQLWVDPLKISNSDTRTALGLDNFYKIYDLVLISHPWANGSIHIQVRAIEDGTIPLKLYDSRGTQVYSTSLSVKQGEHKYDLSIPSGIYGTLTMKLTSSNATISRSVSVSAP